MVFSLRSMDSLVYSFWSLLPSFCNYPLDTAESFKDLQKALCIALNEEPDVRGIICSSLQILIQQNKRVLEGKNDEADLEVSMARQLAVAHYNTPGVAKNNLTVLGSSSSELLSALSNIFLKSTKDGGYLQVCLYCLKNKNYFYFCDGLSGDVLVYFRCCFILEIVAACCLVLVCTSFMSFSVFLFFSFLEFYYFLFGRILCILYVFQYHFCLN